MARVRISKQAWADLESIVSYYEKISPEFALVFEENVLAKVRQLERFPRLGRMVPEINDRSMRELIYRSYRIVYFVDESDEEAELLTIFHSSRQFGGLPGESP